MPEHMLTPEIEIITDGGRRRRWTAAEKLRIVEGEEDRGPSGAASADEPGREPASRSLPGATGWVRTCFPAGAEPLAGSLATSSVACLSSESQSTSASRPPRHRQDASQDHGWTNRHPEPFFAGPLRTGRIGAQSARR